MSMTFREQRIAETRRRKETGEFYNSSGRNIDWEAAYALLDKLDKLPRLDNRTADEIIGYDEDGLFGPSGDFSLTDIEKA